jgi:Zn finger protein HypA/HybF involved in hydrogenase expression
MQQLHTETLDKVFNFGQFSLVEAKQVKDCDWRIEASTPTGTSYVCNSCGATKYSVSGTEKYNLGCHK